MPFLALIDVLGMSGIGSPPTAGQPPFPTNPIAPGGTTPPWGPGLSPSPPGIWPSPGHPAHPIAPGGQPPGIWGGMPWPTPPIAPGGRPDQGLPPGSMVPPPQVGIPVFPSHPIAPGGGGEGGSGLTPGWPSMPGTGPSHPISGGYILVYHPSYGWILIAPGGEGGEGGGSPPKPDQGLPGAQPRPDQGLPEVPPHAQPKK